MSRAQYTLTSEALRKKYGELYVDTVFQNDTMRVGFLRRLLDRRALTYHVVEFYPAGIHIFAEQHAKIRAGALLGETIKKSGVQHERIDSPLKEESLPRILAEIFGSFSGIHLTKTVHYTVANTPYAKILEYFNPEFPIGD